MIRNSKLLAALLLALAALGGVASPAAQAEATFTVPGASAEEKTTLKMEIDGTGKTAHWVLTVANAERTKFVSITCAEVRATEEQYDGDAIGPQFAEFTIRYPQFLACELSGNEVNVENNYCSFTYRSGGELEIHPAISPFLCEHGDGAITFDAPKIECTVEIGEQTLAGITYHTIESEGKKQLTISNGPSTFTYEARGASCPFGTTSNGKLATGNSIIEALTEKGVARSFLWEP